MVEKNSGIIIILIKYSFCCVDCRLAIKRFNHMLLSSSSPHQSFPFAQIINVYVQIIQSFCTPNTKPFHKRDTERRISDRLNYQKIKTKSNQLYSIRAASNRLQFFFSFIRFCVGHTFHFTAI